MRGLQRLVFYTPCAEESRRFWEVMRDTFACSREDELIFAPYTQADEAAQDISHNGATLIGWDVTTDSARHALEGVRQECRQAFLVVIAGQETSPLLFLTPALGPDSLLLRPLEHKELQRATGEMVRAVQEKEQATEGYFSVVHRDGTQRIPYHSIYYFEARGRKIYLRLPREEIGFTGTLEQVEAQLPSNFRRTHRSFIINTDKIEQILLAANLVRLWGGILVPLSRSYKPKIKELCHG